MSNADNYWAKAQNGSPGTMLAEMQAKLYAGETTQRLMEKFDIERCEAAVLFDSQGTRDGTVPEFLA